MDFAVVDGVTSDAKLIDDKFKAVANIMGGIKSRTKWKTAWDHPPIGYLANNHPESAKRTKSWK